jgi:hypothetical protein
MLGCVTEMQKLEGSAYDPIDRIIYTSISTVGNNMLPKWPSGDGQPQDVIKIPKSNTCGCVLKSGMVDAEGFKTSYVKAHLCGSSASLAVSCNASYTDKVKAAAALDSNYGKRPATKVCDDFLYNQCNKSACQPRRTRLHDGA